MEIVLGDRVQHRDHESLGTVVAKHGQRLLIEWDGRHRFPSVTEESPSVIIRLSPGAPGEGRRVLTLGTSGTPRTKRRLQFIGLMNALRSAATRAGDEALVSSLSDCVCRVAAGDERCPMGRLLTADVATGGIEHVEPRSGTPFTPVIGFNPRAAVPFVLRAAKTSAVATCDEPYRVAISECERLVTQTPEAGEPGHCPVARVVAPA